MNKPFENFTTGERKETWKIATKEHQNALKDIAKKKDQLKKLKPQLKALDVTQKLSLLRTELADPSITTAVVDALEAADEYALNSSDYASEPATDDIE